MCVEATHVTSKKHIPRGCRIHYILGLSKELKSICEAYKKQYMGNPFDSMTLDTGNELISKTAVDHKRRWEETGRDDQSTPKQLQNHLVW